MHPDRQFLGWFGVVRLGLVQASLGSIVVLATSTLNRVMVVEFALPAALPGALVALHYFVQMLRPRVGHGADRTQRRTPWIIGGMALLAVGGVLAAYATTQLPAGGSAYLLAVLGYCAIGLGVSAAGTSLLVLLANRVAPGRRAGAATILWTMMIAGFALTSGLAGHFLEPFSAGRLLYVSAAVALIGFLVAALAVWRVEGAPSAALNAPAVVRTDFRTALRQVWRDDRARRFTWFVFVSMLAYSAQELLIEPFAGLVFGYSVGGSAKLSGVWHGSALLGMIGAGVLGGRVGRFGSLRAWMTAGCVGSALALFSLCLASLAGPRYPLELSMIALGLCNGAFAVSAIGSMMELSREGEAAGAGIRMGLWGAAQAIAFALGGLTANLLLDLVRRLLNGAPPAFALVFTIEAACFLSAALLALKLRERSADPLPPHMVNPA